MNQRSVWGAMMGLAMGCSSTSGNPESTTRAAAAPIVPASLSAAHKAYLDGDLLGLGDRIHDVLLDPTASSLVRQNAFELLEKAYETNGGKLPSRFQLPAGYSSIQLGYFHIGTPSGPHYEIHIRGLARDASRVR